MDPTVIELLQPLNDSIRESFEAVESALVARDVAAARTAASTKRVVGDLAERVRTYLATRLAVQTPNGLAAYQIESDLVEDMKRLHTLTRRIARALVRVDQERVSQREPPD
jgi:phosphate:Na+ symporter